MKIVDTFIDFFASRRMTVAEESMLPALRPGDGVVFSRKPLREGGPRRGDIVLIRALNGAGRLDVKRVVGVPGEHVRITGRSVEIDGKPLDEPYVASWARGDPAPRGGSGSGGGGGIRGSAPLPPAEFQLGPDQFAVLSDNRVHPGAVDSRNYGPVSRAAIVGVFARRI